MTANSTRSFFFLLLFPLARAFSPRLHSSRNQICLEARARREKAKAWRQSITFVIRNLDVFRHKTHTQFACKHSSIFPSQFIRRRKFSGFAFVRAEEFSFGRKAELIFSSVLSIKFAKHVVCNDGAYVAKTFAHNLRLIAIHGKFQLCTLCTFKGNLLNPLKSNILSWLHACNSCNDFTSLSVSENVIKRMFDAASIYVWTVWTLNRVHRSRSPWSVGSTVKMSNLSIIEMSSAVTMSIKTILSFQFISLFSIQHFLLQIANALRAKNLHRCCVFTMLLSLFFRYLEIMIMLNGLFAFRPKVDFHWLVLWDLSL